MDILAGVIGRAGCVSLTGLITGLVIGLVMVALTGRVRL